MLDIDLRSFWALGSTYFDRSMRLEEYMINGDNRSSQSIFDQIMYFPQCLMQHRRGKKSGLTVKTVELDFDRGQFEGEAKSPDRILCEAYYAKLDFDAIAHDLGCELHFLDIGCGSGRQGIQLKKFAGEAFGSYKGIDIYKDGDFPTEFRHIQDDAVYSAKYLNGDTNFIFSQSALEHIEKDVECLVGVTSNLLKNQRPFVQLHFVPAPSGLWLYLWHGWRQYSVRNLCALNDILSKLGPLNIHATPLGGARSFFTHLFSITVNVVLLRVFPMLKLPPWYDKVSTRSRIVDAALRDSRSMPSAFTGFWVLVVTSRNIKLRMRESTRKEGATR